MPATPREPTPERFGATPLRWFLATRPAFLSVTLAGCLIGLAAAHSDGLPFDMLRAIVTVVFALLAHAGANVLNDYHDALSGADAANTQRIFPFTGGSRFIQNGVLTERETARLGWALLVPVVPAGIWLAAGSGTGLIAIGLAGLVLGWAYSAPPLKLASRGLGEFAVAAAWLLVVIGADFVQRGTFAWTPVAAGVSFALLVADLLFINQFPDRAGDQAAGKRTLVVQLGADSAKWAYFGVAIIAYGWLVLQVGRYNLPQACAAAALTLVLSFHAARLLREHAEEPAKLAPAIKLTILATNLHGFVLAATLAFGRHT
ncbi:MAG TPA: prenyltransferase [Aromatoleum sp.]|uniref:prenyltransferase n=1 Tax=Aromatoleum sp. TaxID=2307007 RepID=UPI002B4A179A|nr:prenyltransferase [Aromatoleum sp.]HJV28436.1 prenyltransferase [Aromatoleum sp.]